MKNARKIMEFIHYAEGLKTELRLATKSNHQKETVADHSWRLALFIILVAPKLKLKIDVSKALKMAIIHDIVEIEAKDVPILEHIDNPENSKKKQADEKKAINKIEQILGKDSDEIVDLWQEYEESESLEARFVAALDKLEGQWQIVEDPIWQASKSSGPSIQALLGKTTELCQLDPFLKQLDSVTLESRKKRIKTPD